MKTPKFVEECEKCETNTGVTLSFWDKATDRSTEVVEDDGALIIRKGGIRAVFNIGQDNTLKEQNERIRKVLSFLKLEKTIEKVSWGREDLQDEEDEEEKENGRHQCPWCGNHHD
jgi:hypothetical protein